MAAGRTGRTMRRRVLAPVLLLLLGSAALRLAVGAEAALAEGEAAPETPPSQQVADCPIPEVSDEVIAALTAREARLTAAELQFADRMQALRVAETEIDTKLAELRAAEESLAQTLALADSAAEDDVARLTAVYENMKPDQAAALFQQMDPAFAAGFLARMRPDAAAGILSGLPPETAYTISALLAGRNANAPRN